MRRLERNSDVDLITRTRQELDLLDSQAVKRLFELERPDAVVLAAGKVGGIVENLNDPAAFLEENLSIQSNVLSIARRSTAQRVVFFASSCMYPSNCDHAMSENDLLSAPPEPSSIAYATAKLAGLQLCLAYNLQDGGSRFIPLIPNSVYGPHDNFDSDGGHVLAALVARFHGAKQAQMPGITLWGSGSPRREFIHADDLAECVDRLLKDNISSVEFPLNVGSGSDISIKELASLIARVVGYEGEIIWDSRFPDGAQRKLLDSNRVRAIGWRPKLDLERGLEQTYEWYKSQIENASEG